MKRDGYFSSEAGDWREYWRPFTLGDRLQLWAAVVMALLLAFGLAVGAWWRDR